MIDLWRSSWKKIGRYRGVVILLWVSTWVFSFPVFIYMQASLSRLAKTNVPAEWLQSFVFTYLTEFISDDPAFLGLLFAWVLFLSVMYFLINIFLTGGIIGVVTHSNPGGNTPFEWSFFWASAKKFMLRFFLLSLVTGAMMLIPMALMAFGTPGIVLTLLAWFFWVMVSDMSKIRIASLDIGLARSFFDAIRLVIKNLFPLLGLYCLNLIPLLAIFVVWWWVDAMINANSAVKMAIIYGSHQLLIIMRAVVRIQIFDMLAIFHKLKCHKPEISLVEGETTLKVHKITS